VSGTAQEGSQAARTRFFVGAAAVAVLSAAAVGAWLQPRPTLGSDDARRFVVEALTTAGVDGVVTATEVAAGVSPPDAPLGSEAFDTWIVTATVLGGEIEVHVDQQEAQAVYVLDRADGGGGLLTAEQVQVIDDFDDNPLLDDRLARNLAASTAGVFGAIIAAVLTDGARRDLDGWQVRR